MSLQGRQIGRYKILEPLGQGGMSVVYKGLDTSLDREVAVKVLHPHLASREESRKRLAREAKAVARLHHPNILEVFDYAGEQGSEAYIVTEYIRGQTLRQFLASDGFEPPEVAAMVIHEIAAALAHAHEHGVIHRDLKPENVMVREDGVLKLMDFGIAKILDRDERMTITGALVGSPAHMAPEIIEGLEAGAEADVFSLGTMLYLFATGRLPFAAANTTATLKRILDGIYDDPRQVVPTISDELAEIITACLARNPAQRYPNAGKLRDALHTLLADLGFDRVHEELPRYFASAATYRKELAPRLTSALLERAERQLAAQRHAKALSSLNLVLAHDPTNARAKAMLASMQAAKARARRRQRLIRASFSLGAAVIVSTAAWKGYAIAARAPDYQAPLLRGPASITLPASVYPAPEPRVEPPPETPPEVRPQVAVLDRPQVPTPVARTITPATIKPVAAVAPTSPAGALAQVSVMIRPWGYLSIDGGKRSGDAQPTHRLELPVGEHRYTVTCDACEAAGHSGTFVVNPGGENRVVVVAPLLPSLVSFEGFPPEAQVRIGKDVKTVADTAATPFRVEMPREGSNEMRFPVRYEVTLDGQVLQDERAMATPGQPLVIRRKAKSP